MLSLSTKKFVVDRAKGLCPVSTPPQKEQLSWTLQKLSRTRRMSFWNIMMLFKDCCHSEKVFFLFRSQIYSCQIRIHSCWIQKMLSSNGPDAEGTMKFVSQKICLWTGYHTSDQGYYKNGSIVGDWKTQSHETCSWDTPLTCYPETRLSQ